MSQVGTNHYTAETPTRVHGDYLNGESWRDSLSANFAPRGTDGSGGRFRSASAEESRAAPTEFGDAVNPAAMENLRSMDAGDEGFLLQIIELFLSDLTQRITAMKVAAETRDAAALKSIAHALKGSCGHFGASRLAARCLEMEQVAARQPMGDPNINFLELEAEAGRVRIALEQAKKSHSQIP